MHKLEITFETEKMENYAGKEFLIINILNTKLNDETIENYEDKSIPLIKEIIENLKSKNEYSGI